MTSSRHAWRRRQGLTRWERQLAVRAQEPDGTSTGSTLPGAEQLALISRAARLCGLLGATGLLRWEVDNDNDAVCRDLGGVPVAMVRPLVDGSLARVF